MKRKILIGLIKFVFAGAILYWLWNSDRLDFSVVARLMSFSDLFTLFALGLLSLLFFAARFYILLKNQGLSQSFYQAWRLSMIGLFFNFTLPGGTGGDLVKIFYLAKSNSTKRGVVVSTVVLDRLIGLTGMLGMAFVSLLSRPRILLNDSDIQILFAITSLSLILIGAGFLVLKSKLKSDALSAGQVGRFLASIGELPNGWVLLKAVLLTILSQTVAVLLLYFGAKAAGYQNLDLLSFFVVAPLGFILTAIPISPGGIGVGQVGFYALFHIYTDVASDLGPSVVTIYQLLLFIFSLSGLYYYLRMGRELKTAPLV